VARSATIASLRARCIRLRDGLRDGETATQEELDEIWPGGPDNPGHDLQAWIRCSEQLHAICGRIALKLERGTENEAERRAAQEAALLDTPETVTLAGLDEDGEPQHLIVYPKGGLALTEIQKRSITLAAMADDLALLEQHGTADDVEIIVRVHEEQFYLLRVIAWIATSRGAGIPYEEGDLRPTVPQLYSDLHPADLYLIAAAFQRVNVKRLLLLDRTKRSDTRPTWPMLWASLASELNKTVPEIMRDYSLASLLSQASERARGQEQAREAAERDAKHKPRAA
jgi:hypothetical protein